LALTSGDKATPASPIAPERESGEIFRKGTAVGIAFTPLPLVVVVLCAAANAGKASSIYVVNVFSTQKLHWCNLVLLFKNNINIQMILSTLTYKQGH
jgi:hypothetical protein